MNTRKTQKEEKKEKDKKDKGKKDNHEKNEIERPRKPSVSYHSANPIMFKLDLPHKNYSQNGNAIKSSDESGSSIEKSPSGKSNQSSSMASSLENLKSSIGEAGKSLGRARLFSSGSNTLTNSNSNLNSPTPKMDTKQYSSIKILNEAAFSHNYLFTFTTEKLHEFYKKAIADFQNKKTDDTCFLSTSENNGKKSPKEIKENCVEILVFKTEKDTEKYYDCYLLDRKQIPGHTRGAGGSVYIAYKIPAKTDHHFRHSMLDSVVAIKEFLPRDDKKAKSLEAGLKKWGQYINHGRCEKSDFFVMKYYDGPNLIDFIYVRNLAVHKDLVDHITCKRYIKPEHLLEISLKKFNLVNYFHKKTGFLHTDIKTQNFVLEPSLELKLIDLDDVTPVTDKLTSVFSSPGYSVPEVNPKSKKRDYFQTKSELYQTILCIFEMLSVYPYQKRFRVKQIEENKEFAEDFTHAEYCSMLSDICIEPFLIEIFTAKKIQHTWMNLPTEELFTLVSELFVHYLPEDVLLIKENREHLINEIVFRLYVVPDLVKTLSVFFQENPDKRPNEDKYPLIEEKLLELLSLYKQLCLYCNQQGPRKLHLSVPDLECLTRENIINHKNEIAEEKKDDEIRLVFRK